MVGDMLEELGRHEAAVEAYQKTVEAIPHYEEAWFNLGQCLIVLEQDKKALGVINRFLKL